MRRRAFLVALFSGAAAATGTRAQRSATVYRIAMIDLSAPVAEMTENGVRAYRGILRELRRLGYIEGQDLVIERYSLQGRAFHDPELVREVVRSKPNVILALGNPLVLDFKAATTSIPIVGLSSDPVSLGIVASLARPGGNITGVSVDAGIDIWSKRLELLRETAPNASRMEFLGSRMAWDGPYGGALREAARRFGIAVVGPPFDAPFHEEEYRRMFAAMVAEGTGAIVVSDLPDNSIHRQLVVELANENRLPAIYPLREFVEIGGLMAYAFDDADVGRHAAGQIDFILKGTKPADIPIYQPTKFELLINLKTAKTLGIEIPGSLVALADEVIE
jgi:putative tryptophan/tyrosine transport system substrate-binding protein